MRAMNFFIFNFAKNMLKTFRNFYVFFLEIHGVLKRLKKVLFYKIVEILYSVKSSMN